MRNEGIAIGVLGVTSFRPFPLTAVRDALQGARRVVVLEKSLAVGLGGIVASDVRKSISGLPLVGNTSTVVAGLGGRAITKSSLHRVLRQAIAGTLESLHFLDMDWNVVNRQLARERAPGRTGPAAEQMLRDVGPVAARIG
jgi:pyruvate ferredoxin oxidoreductase alpha subunit